ncbi:hypothetical protein CROQUDRAFT_574500 [Cronartium quercuum f. sp. fusiforme G11]|uniref:Uncharacterized protein n=1 Tax=Cronartium quercuum f. sp. fusiforme G11 TaxID=708437 RepID=A0A9P6NVR2_9BASI|nr:hypothetical protein CROQUDRAFT_574500 [Cronartium quercuum f. sp. fusiforme G11]
MMMISSDSNFLLNLNHSRVESNHHHQKSKSINRFILIPQNYHQSPSREQTFSRRNSLVKLLDDAMGINRLPHKHCDPPLENDHHHHHHRSLLSPRTVSNNQLDEQDVQNENVIEEEEEEQDDIDQEIEKLPPKPYGVLKMELITFKLRSGKVYLVVIVL